MERKRLDIDALAVETFAAADAEGLDAGAAQTKFCSYIDACPSRLCDTSRC